MMNANHSGRYMRPKLALHASEEWKLPLRRGSACTHLTLRPGGTPRRHRSRIRPRRKPLSCPAQTLPALSVHSSQAADVLTCRRADSCMCAGGRFVVRAIRSKHRHRLDTPCEAFAHREAGVRPDELHEALRQVAARRNSDALAVHRQHNRFAPHRRLAHRDLGPQAVTVPSDRLSHCDSIKAS